MAQGHTNAEVTEGYSPTLTTVHDGPPIIAFTSKDYGQDVGEVSPTLRSMDGEQANGGGQVAVAFAENQRGEVRTADVAMSLSTSGGKPGSGYPAVAVSLRGREGGVAAEVSEECATALRASQGGGDKQFVATDYTVRRLTPRECEALQGFPRDWTRIPWRGKPAEDCPDGPRYKAIGNSMATNVMEWLGRRIAAVVEVAP